MIGHSRIACTFRGCHAPGRPEKVRSPRPALHQLSDGPALLEPGWREPVRAVAGGYPGGQPISLYAHVPFCDTLCWYCGCNTKITQKYEPVARYLTALETEICNVAGKVASSLRVAHIHWGGGSPSVLTPDHIVELATS